MLLLALSIHTVTTIASSRKPAAVRPALRMSVGACSNDARCTGDPDDRYRVQQNGEPLIDRKDEALGGYWKRCETTGMPVCPATSGSVKYSTTID